MVLLNGRSKSNSKGTNTYVGKNKCSTLDLAWIEVTLLERIIDFEVKEIGTSDNLPTVIQIKDDPEIESTPVNVNISKKLKWNQENAENKNLLDIHETLIEGIKKAAKNTNMEQTLNITSGTDRINKEWLHKDCRKSRKEVKMQNRIYRKNQDKGKICRTQRQIQEPNKKQEKGKHTETPKGYGRSKGCKELLKNSKKTAKQIID